MSAGKAPRTTMQKLRSAEAKLRRSFEQFVEIEVGPCLSESEHRVLLDAYSELLEKVDKVATERHHKE